MCNHFCALTSRTFILCDGKTFIAVLLSGSVITPIFYFLGVSFEVYEFCSESVRIFAVVK